MTERSIEYITFTIERCYAVPPNRVFAAFADVETKAKWADDPDEPPADEIERVFEFRVGGRERFGFKMPSGPTMSYDALYYDIVADQRIVYCYEMYADGGRISVSIATIEFAEDFGSESGRDVGGTKLTYTEQGVYLDGLDRPENRQQGTEWMLDNLVRLLRSDAETTS
jgi:uncharacterized protein YndB with AHSA1/START domain